MPMINYFQAIILGALQGISELFPVSSLGHSVIFPRLFGWHINQSDPSFLTFLVATHFATAIVLFLFFWKDWWAILKGLGRSFQARQIDEHDTYAKLGWLLIVGTIPTGLLGILLEQKLKSLFASPQIAAGFLFLNGFILLGGEMLRRRKKQKEMMGNTDIRIARLTWKQSAIVGIGQAIALLPGFSRTGATLTGSLLVGLSHEDALRFSFLLATPIIGAAALLKLPELATAPSSSIISVLLGALAAGTFAYLAVKFLTKYFQTNTLTPFGIYCLLMGAITSIVFLFR